LTVHGALGEGRITRGHDADKQYGCTVMASRHGICLLGGDVFAFRGEGSGQTKAAKGNTRALACWNPRRNRVSAEEGSIRLRLDLRHQFADALSKSNGSRLGCRCDEGEVRQRIAAPRRDARSRGTSSRQYWMTR